MGTPQRLINKDATVGWGAQYQAYGLAAPTTELITNPLRFPGQYEDQESGLYQNFHRDYDPRVGAYGTQDPFGVFQTGANRYGYVYGNPVGLMDPSGQETYISVCSRPPDVPLLGYFGDHQWIKTHNFETGMGPQNGGIPGHDSSSDLPGTKVQTNDHKGEYRRPEVNCRKVPRMKIRCVNKLIKPGRDLGRWLPWNQCNTFVADVIEECRRS